jgi:hypothetical protein
VAVMIDQDVRATMATRRAAGRESTLYLRVEHLPSRGFPIHCLTVSWAPRHWPRRHLVARDSDGLKVIMDQRIARYTHWHDVVISLWRLGPWTRLEVRDELSVLLQMEEWELAHPADYPAVGEQEKALSRA